MLRELSAGFRAGATCVAGPSGAASRRMLRLLNRLADPDAGTVRYRGADVRGLDPLELRREVCLVPQLPALLEGTVADEPPLRGRARRARAGRRAAARPRRARPRLRRPRRRAGSRSESSSGRCSPARWRSSPVLLLDEPTSALDEDTRDAVEATLRDLRERLEMSIVLVTHDLEQARRMSDWVVRLDAGAVEQGPAAEVLRA